MGLPDRAFFFDLETTGTDPYGDRVVEIAAVVADRHGAGWEVVARWQHLVHPGRFIPEAATAVHGISDDDVADAPIFEELAPQIQEAVRGCVLVGYNIRAFDTVLLDRELRLAGEDGLERDEWDRIVVPEVDLYEVWRRSEPRTLEEALFRFAGIDLGDRAHGAEADTEGLPDLTVGMARTFGLDLEEMAELSTPEWEVDRDGRFRREDGEVVFNFGKHRGAPAASAPDYLQWMLTSDFPPETKAFCRLILGGHDV
ncbi:MAG: exonuclease domain-containing protein [Longimicrobiales bacterium]